MEKRDAGKALFLDGDALADIAEKLNVSVKTVERWSAAGNWAAKRVAHEVFSATIEERIIELIEWNLGVLSRRVKMYANESAETLIDKEEIEALVRLYQVVKTPEQKYNEAIRLTRKALEYIQRENLEAAKPASTALAKMLDDIRQDSKPSFSTDK